MYIFPPPRRELAMDRRAAVGDQMCDCIELLVGKVGGGDSKKSMKREEGEKM